MSAKIDPNKIVIFTGAGISAESGIATYRDPEGEWQKVNPDEVASAGAWAKNPQRVLEFFNARMESVLQAEPNAAHIAIAELETDFDVAVITQNVDDLHERAGSRNVIHLHGEILSARYGEGGAIVQNRNGEPIRWGDMDEEGRQLRPDVVFFGEDMKHREEAIAHLKTAARVLVVGTSLQVYPAAGLLKKARFHAEKVLVAKEIFVKQYGFRHLRGNATDLVPVVTSRWRNEGAARIDDP